MRGKLGGILGLKATFAIVHRLLQRFDADEAEAISSKSV